MKTVQNLPQPRFPALGESSLSAVQGAVHAALADHGKAGRTVVVWRDGRAIEVRVDENGDEIIEA